MSLVIIHGSAVNPKNDIPEPHTEERIRKCVETLDWRGAESIAVVGAKNEAYPIALYLNRACLVESSSLLIMPLGYSTLSNLYYSKMLLYLFSKIAKPIRKVYEITSYWNSLRAENDSKKILREYDVECIGTPDSRNNQEMLKDIKMEKMKLVLDKIFLKLQYGRHFNAERLYEEVGISYFFPRTIVTEEVKTKINHAIPRYQKFLMWLERKIDMLRRRH